MEKETTKKKKKFGLIGTVMKYVVPLCITVGLLYVMAKQYDLNEIKRIIVTGCDFKWIALALVISIFSHIFRAMRWRIQLRALGVQAPLFALVLSIFGTYAVNLVLPRLGEVWRTGYISVRQKAPFSTVFGSMVADRLADTVTVALLTLTAFVLASSTLTHYLAQNAALYEQVMGLVSSPWLWLGVAALVAFAWWFLAHKSTNKVVLWAQGFVRGLWDGFAVIVHMPGKAWWLLYTVLIWGCYFMQLFVAFFAFDFTTDVVSQYGIVAVLVTFVLSSISMGVPSNGGLGPWQWSVVFALGIYGVANTPAAAFANTVMGMQTLLLIVLGIFTFVCIMVDNKRKRRVQPDNSK